MKKLFLLIQLIFSVCLGYAQTTGYIRNDTVKITNTTKTATLVLETASKGHNWYLKDIGNGRTQFVQAEIADINHLQDSLNKKANDANVIHKTGDEIINGYLTVTGGFNSTSRADFDYSVNTFGGSDGITIDAGATGGTANGIRLRYKQDGSNWIGLRADATNNYIAFGFFPFNNQYGAIYMNGDNITDSNNKYFLKASSNYTPPDSTTIANNYLHKTGNLTENITGIKTFSDQVRTNALYFGNSGDYFILSNGQSSLQNVSANLLSVDGGYGIGFNVSNYPSDPSRHLFYDPANTYGGDLWIADNAATNARRILTTRDLTTFPDSTSIANSYIKKSGGSMTGALVNNESVSIGTGGYVKSYTSPNIAAHQGYAYDGAYHYIFGTTDIKKYDSAWSLVTSNGYLFGADATMIHAGPGFISGNLIYINVENATAATNSAGGVQRIFVFNKSDLSYNSVIDNSYLSSLNLGGALCLDVANDRLYAANYFDGTIGVFQFSTNTFITSYNSNLSGIQGLRISGNLIYISSNSGIYTENKGDGSNKTIIYSPKSSDIVMEGFDIVSNQIRLLEDFSNNGTNASVVYLDPTTLSAAFSADKSGLVKTGGDAYVGSYLYVTNNVSAQTSYNSAIFNGRGGNLSKVDLQHFGYDVHYGLTGNQDRFGLWFNNNSPFSANANLFDSTKYGAFMGVENDNTRFVLKSSTTSNSNTFTDRLSIKFDTGNTSIAGNTIIGGTSPRQQLSVGSYLDIYSGAANSPTQSSIRASSAGNLILNPFGSASIFLGSDNSQAIVYVGPNANAQGITFDGTAGAQKIGIGTSPTLTPTHALSLTSTVAGSGIASYNADGTNFERLRQYWSGNIFNITTETGGTGTIREIRLGQSPSGVGTVANYVGVQSSSDLGIHTFKTGALVGSGIFGGAAKVSTILQASGGMQYSLLLGPTINQNSTAGYSALMVSPYEQATGSGNKFLINAGTNTAADGTGSHTAKFTVDNAGKTIVNLNNLGAYGSLTGNLTYDGQTALYLKNTTAATSAGSQQSPTLKLSGQYWDGSASQEMQAGITMVDNGSGTNSSFVVGIRRGATANWSRILSIDAFGQFETPFKYSAFNAGSGTNIGCQFGNGASATATQNQNSPAILAFGSGWKSASTAASQTMAYGEVLSPESGTTNPVGVYKGYYGTNSSAAASANELYRFEWGDRLGFTLNSNNLTGYVTKVNSIINTPLLTASQLVGTDGSKNLVSLTALPSGTTAITQTSADNSTKVATTAFVQSNLNAKQGTLTLTTTGSGAATLVGNTLNIPNNAANASSSTYTPTITDISGNDDFDNYTIPNKWHYLRIGNEVQVSGIINVSSSNTTGTAILELSLPVSSTLASSDHITGQSNYNSESLNSNKIATLVGYSVNNKPSVSIKWNGDTVSDGRIAVNFTYTIIE